MHIAVQLLLIWIAASAHLSHSHSHTARFSGHGSLFINDNAAPRHCPDIAGNFYIYWVKSSLGFFILGPKRSAGPGWFSLENFVCLAFHLRRSTRRGHDPTFDRIFDPKPSFATIHDLLDV